MGKDTSGERVYAGKYYLLWNFREIVTMFNSDQNENASYHTLCQAVAETFSQVTIWKMMIVVVPSVRM